MLSSVGAHAPTPKYKFSVNQQIFTIEIIGQAANPWTVHPPPFSSSFAPGLAHGAQRVCAVRACGYTINIVLEN